MCYNVEMRINATWRQIDNIIVSDAPRGRLLALHHHSSMRVRKKYQNAIVLMRGSITRESIHDVARGCLSHMSERCRRRFCHALRKMGINARVERFCRRR